VWGDANVGILTALIFVGALVVFGSLAMVAGNMTGTARLRVRRRLDLVSGVPTESSEQAYASLRRLSPHDKAGSFDQLLGRLLPSRDKLTARLARTGRDITLSRYVLISAAVAFVITVLLWSMLSLPFAIALLVGAGAGIALPHLAVNRMITRRTNRFLEGFPDALDLIVRCVRSGLSVPEAMRNVSDEMPGPVGEEFPQICDGIRLGQTLEQALGETAVRLTISDFNFFVISLSVQRETGGNLAETLGNLSKMLRRRRQMKLKVRAMSSEARASAYIVGALPFLMIGVLFVIKPDYIGTMFTDPRGMFVLGAGFLSQMFGVIVMMKMTRFEI
jgi:tight adherence protein B